jgi:hypothetical protein
MMNIFNGRFLRWVLPSLVACATLGCASTKISVERVSTVALVVPTQTPYFGEVTNGAAGLGAGADLITGSINAFIDRNARPIDFDRVVRRQPGHVALADVFLQEVEKNLATRGVRVELLQKGAPNTPRFRIKSPNKLLLTREGEVDDIQRLSANIVVWLEFSTGMRSYGRSSAFRPEFLVDALVFPKTTGLLSDRRTFVHGPSFSDKKYESWSDLEKGAPESYLRLREITVAKARELADWIVPSAAK